MAVSLYHLHLQSTSTRSHVNECGLMSLALQEIRIGNVVGVTKDESVGLIDDLFVDLFDSSRIYSLNRLEPSVSFSGWML